MNATPIRTQYNGIRFRSRLEARWAFFFAELGVKWQYEPEGFQLSSGWYLPDFWLPDQNCWVEIKPPFDVEYDREREDMGRIIGQCSDLAEVTSKRVYLLSANFGDWLSQQWSDQRGMLAIVPRKDGHGVDLDVPHLPCRCHGCGKFGFSFEGRADRLCAGGCTWSGDDFSMVAQAIESAQRFSFWEPSR